LQLAKLQEELHKKDSRWSATQVRTRDRLKQLEQENAQLKNEVEKLKKEKLNTTRLVRFVVVVVVVEGKEHVFL
jgi:predicted nuclease with TOPRIM domain